MKPRYALRLTKHTREWWVALLTADGLYTVASSKNYPTPAEAVAHAPKPVIRDVVHAHFGIRDPDTVRRVDPEMGAVEVGRAIAGVCAPVQTQPLVCGCLNAANECDIRRSDCRLRARFGGA